MLHRCWAFIRWTGTRSLVLPASQFSELLHAKTDIAPIHTAFHGNPLASLNRAVRGDIIARVARNLHDSSAGKIRTEDPELDFGPSGRRRSRNQAAYDWLCDGRRTECKSSIMTWSRSNQRWRFHFAGIKLATAFAMHQALFDDLVIVLLTPRDLHIYQHDLSFGVSSLGYGTEISGHGICLYGPRGEQCWERSSNEILEKLNSTTNGCQHLATLSVTHDDVQAELRSHVQSSTSMMMGEAYRNTPMHGFNGVSRSYYIRGIARSVDELINAGAAFDDPEQAECVNGALRARHQVKYHWFRDGLRVKCKSAQLSWEEALRKWNVRFRREPHSTSQSSISSYDELLLVLYTPRGLYFYRHCFPGLLTERSMTIAGPVGEQNWSVALDAILVKLGPSCVRIALVRW